MTDLARLQIRVESLEAERAEKRLDSMTRSGARAERATDGLRRSAKLLTGALAAVGVTTGLRASIDTIGQFQVAMNGLAATSNATAGQMEKLEGQARTLGATTQFSATQSAEAQRFLAQAGFEVNEVLSSTPGILKLAQAGQLDLAEAADIASNVLGGMRYEVDQLNRVNDVMAATASRSNTNIRQLGDALSYAAPLAATAGLEVEEVSAAIGVMSDAGIQGTRAGTGMVGILRQLSEITPRAASALEEMGLSADDVNIEVHGLTQVLENLRGAELNTSRAIRLFGSEAAAAGQVLVSSYTGPIKDANGEADRMSAQMNQDLIPALKGLGSALSEATLQLGDKGLAGGLEAVIVTATGVVSSFNGMTDEFNEANNISEEHNAVIQTLTASLQTLTVLAGGRLVAALTTATGGIIKKTAASVADAKAEAAAAVATTRRTKAEVLMEKRLLGRAIAEARATRGTDAHTAALTRLAAARQRATAAATQHATATKAASGAMARASGTARVLGGALSLVGGPLGLMVGAGGLLYIFREQLGLVERPALSAAAAVEELSLRVDDAADSMLKFEVAAFTAELVALQAEASGAERRLATLRETANEPYSFGQGQQADLSSGIRRQEAELETITNKIGAREKAIDTLMERMEQLRKAEEEGSESTRRVSVSVEDLKDETEDATKELEKFRSSLESLLDTLFPVEASQRRFREDQELLAEAFLKGEISVGRYIESLERLEEASRNPRRAADVYGFDGMTKKAEEATSQIEEFAKQGARNMQDSFADFLFNPFDEGLEGMLTGFASVVQRMVAEAVAADLAGRLFGEMGGGSGNGWLGTALNLAGTAFGFGGGGTSYAGSGWASSATSFDGGGYTGDSPRLGGIDGKGGFLSVLHPQETVVDHTKGQKGQPVTQNITNNFTFEERKDNRTQSQVSMAASQAQRRATARFGA